MRIEGNAPSVPEEQAAKLHSSVEKGKTFAVNVGL
jgi:hypothetical protein